MEENEKIIKNQNQNGIKIEEQVDEKCSVSSPGTYFIDGNGIYHKTVDWQSAIDRIKWEEIVTLIERLTQRGTSERKLDILGMYVLVAITIIGAGYLGSTNVLEGQAIAGFFGAAIGYLLSRA